MRLHTVEMAKSEYISGVIRIETPKALLSGSFPGRTARKLRTILLSKLSDSLEYQSSLGIFPLTRATAVNTLKALLLQ